MDALDAGTQAYGKRMPNVSESLKLLPGVAVPDSGEKGSQQQRSPLRSGTDTPIRLLIVEDSEFDRYQYRELLAKCDHRYALTEVTWAEQALCAIAEQRFDCVLLDNKLPGLSGLQFMESLQHLPENSRPPVILITGYETNALGARALGSGAYECLDKGRLDSEVLERTILFCVSRHCRKQSDECLEISQHKAAFANLASAVASAELALPSSCPSTLGSFSSSASCSFRFSPKELPYAVIRKRGGPFLGSPFVLRCTEN